MAPEKIQEALAEIACPITRARAVTFANSLFGNLELLFQTAANNRVVESGKDKFIDELLEPVLSIIKTVSPKPQLKKEPSAEPAKEAKEAKKSK